MNGQWYRCSRCGQDSQMVDGKMRLCCWADKYPIPAELADPPDTQEAER